MTKEELEKEAKEYLAEHSKYSEVFGEFFVAVDTLTAMLDFAEPREKRIADLEKENERLTDELNSLRKSIKDYGAGCYENGLRNGKRKLEAQIEKMKCCYNCSKWNDGECEESPKSKTFFCADFKCDNWEMFK